MDTTEIRKLIAAAQREEKRTGQLREKLTEDLVQLQEKLELPDDAPVEALMKFVCDYIESVPGCLNLVDAVSKRLGFHDYAAPFLAMARDYFLQPPEVLPGDEGLEALLDEAFLAHRLLEEVNDHHIRHLQRPLLPVDMTEANLIVHYLLGDTFATRLEQLVQFAASQLLEQEHVWDRVKALPGVGHPAMESISSDTFTSMSQSVRLRLSGR